MGIVIDGPGILGCASPGGEAGDHGIEPLAANGMLCEAFRIRDVTDADLGPGEGGRVGSAASHATDDVVAALDERLRDGPSDGAGGAKQQNTLAGAGGFGNGHGAQARGDASRITAWRGLPMEEVALPWPLR